MSRRRDGGELGEKKLTGETFTSTVNTGGESTPAPSDKRTGIVCVIIIAGHWWNSTHEVQYFVGSGKVSIL